MPNSKLYNKIKIRLTILRIILNFILLLILVFSPLTEFLEKLIYSYTSNDYLVYLSFLLSIAALNFLITFPIEFYSSYTIEHKFELSNQKFSDWIILKIKGSIVSGVIVFSIALIFFYVLKNFELWWLILTIFISSFSILLLVIAPIIIFPIFYKFTPLEDKILKERLTDLCRRLKIDFTGIFTFDMSKLTKKANAGLTGIFKSKRVILSDTLLENFSDNEILTIFAHELGHYKKRHIFKNILINFVITFTIFFLTDLTYHSLHEKLGFQSITQISALPVLFLILLFFSILLMPLKNLISRKFEYEADKFAVISTGDKISFINALKKLSKINLADETPHPLVEFIFYSHPSIKKRIDTLSSLVLNQKN